MCINSGVNTPPGDTVVTPLWLNCRFQATQTQCRLLLVEMQVSIVTCLVLWGPEMFTDVTSVSNMVGNTKMFVSQFWNVLVFHWKNSWNSIWTLDHGALKVSVLTSNMIMMIDYDDINEMMKVLIKGQINNHV